MIRSLYRLGDRRANALLSLVLLLIALTAVLIAAVLVCLVPLVAALLSAQPSDALLPAQVMVGLALALLIVEWTTSMISTSGAMAHIVRLHELLAEQLVRIPLGYFTADRAGAIASLAAKGVPMAAKGPSGLVRAMARGLLAPVLAVAGLSVVDPPTGLCAAAGVVVVYLVYLQVHRVNRATELAVDASDSEGSARVLEFAQRQPAVRTAGPDSLAEQAVRDALRGQAAAKGRSESRRSGANLVMNLTVYASLGASIAVATVRFGAAAIEFGSYAGIVVLLTVLAGFVLRFLPFGRGIELAKIAIHELDAVLSTRVLPEPAVPADPGGADIEFEHVSFSYSEGVPVLADVSLRIPEGGLTVIVGASGSGKTTLLRLIARFWDVDAGSVRIGGADVREMATHDLLSNLSMVFQDAQLLEGSLRENIRLGRADATDDDVLRAAELAGVTEIADRLPRGFDSAVGEAGATLSGGERQRLAIARAVLKDAPVLLLDEATAALDIGNEALVHRTLAALRGRRTIVVIAHRLSFVREADHVVVLDGRGGVEAQGTHDELLGVSETYWRFCMERSEAASWKL